MAMTCPAEVDLTRLRNAVQLIYARVALDPASAFSFHHGVEYAVRWLGYDLSGLMTLPAEVTSCFAGVGNPHAIGPLHAGERVADLGCGSGTDLLLAARRVGRRGGAVGVDNNASMRERAERGAGRGGFEQVAIRYGDLGDLPLSTGSFDVVQSNRVLSLMPDKGRAIAEMARVLRPGGRLHLSDVILERELPDTALRDVGLWAGGIAGAVSAAELLLALSQGGFRRARITARFDCFAGTDTEQLARRHGAHGANLFAIKA